MGYEGAYSQKWTQDHVPDCHLYGTTLNHFKMSGLSRGTLTEMNPGPCTRPPLTWDNPKPPQDERIMKGHTHRNEPRIYALCYYLYGTILNHFKMSGLWRGILTEMNPGFMHCINI